MTSRLVAGFAVCIWMASLAACTSVGGGKSDEQTAQAKRAELIGACNNSELSMAVRHGGGLGSDYASGVEICRKACESGDGLSCYNVGWAYATGRGVEKNPGAAIEAYRLGCDAGDGVSCAIVAEAYKSGDGVERDEGMARDYRARGLAAARKACDAGDGDSCSWLAWRYREGLGVEASKQTSDELDARALGLLRSACQRGDGKACNRVGSAYEFWDSVERNLIEARDFYIKACDLGDAGGCNAAAWVLATSADASIHDGPAAVRYAARAIELVPGRASFYDTLAASYARSGQFVDAVRTQEKAIELCEGCNRKGFEQRLALYRSGKAYQEQ